MANNALIQGAGQVYRAKAAKTLAIGSGLVKGGTDVSTEYFKQKEERDKTDKENAALAAIYQQTAVNEAGYDPITFGEVEKKVRAHNQMLLDVYKKRLNPTLYQSVLTSKTKELDNELQTINNIAKIRTTANGYIRANKDKKIGIKLSDQFRLTEGGEETINIVQALADGSYKFSSISGEVIINDKDGNAQTYNQVQLKEHVERYQGSMYNVFEATKKKTDLMNELRSITTQKGVEHWKASLAGVHNWSDEAIVENIKSQLIDEWGHKGVENGVDLAKRIQDMNAKEVEEEWVKTVGDWGEQWLNIQTPVNVGEEYYKKYDSLLSIALTSKNGISKLISGLRQKPQWDGQDLLGTVYTGDADNPIANQPLYNPANGDLTIYLEGEDGESGTEVLNMKDPSHRDIFIKAMAFEDLGNTDEYRTVNQYSSSAKIGRWNMSVEEGNKVISDFAEFSSIEPKNWDDEQKQFFQENAQFLVNNTALTVEDANNKLIEAGLIEAGEKETTPITTPETSARAILKNAWMNSEEFKGLEAYLRKIDTKRVTNFWTGKREDKKYKLSEAEIRDVLINGRVPSWVVRREDFNKQFGEAYPASSYRDIGMFTEEKRLVQMYGGSKRGGQANIIGKGDTLGMPNADAKAKIREQTKRSYLTGWEPNFIVNKKSKAVKDMNALSEVAKANQIDISINKLIEIQKKVVDFAKGDKGEKAGEIIKYPLSDEHKKLIENNQDKFTKKFLYMLDIIDTISPNQMSTLPTPTPLAGEPATPPDTSEPTQQTPPPDIPSRGDQDVIPNQGVDWRRDGTGIPTEQRVGTADFDVFVPKPTGKEPSNYKKIEEEKDSKDWFANVIVPTKWYKGPLRSYATMEDQETGKKIKLGTHSIKGITKLSLKAEMEKIAGKKHADNNRGINKNYPNIGYNQFVSEKLEFIDGKQVLIIYDEWGRILEILRQE